MHCVFCHNELVIKDKIGRKDVCPHCSQDLHCCKQCKFYEQSAYNECKEVTAERIFDKERSNFCEFFIIRGSKDTNGKAHRVQNAKKALEALFRKGK